MIAFGEFKPEKPGLFVGEARHLEARTDALAEANAWIDRESIDVLNVESFAEEVGFGPTCLRVWYRTPSLSSPRTA